MRLGAFKADVHSPKAPQELSKAGLGDLLDDV